MTAEGVAMETPSVAVPVAQTHDDTPKAAISDAPSSAAPNVATTVVKEMNKRASITSFEQLSTAGLDAATLLAILEEVRDCIGPKVVSNAITRVMKNGGRTTNSIQREQAARKGKKKDKKPRKSGPVREFQMSNYKTRSVAVKFLYAGEKYAGFARQDHMDETVERYLIDALIRTKLISSIDDAGYSRCGRTDRGVSAFGQVVALTLRSNLPVDAELLDVDSIDQVGSGAKFRVKLANGEIKTLTEVDYSTHLNRALPSEIRVYSVVPCKPEFSARFDCKARMYRYFFVAKDLDIERMREAAKLLVGGHDFRNFCRIDTNCEVFRREIKSFEIVKCDDHEATDSRHQLYRCEIYGRAFLWHQVRCMMQILFMIGSGQEEPSIVSQLLDIEQTPRKPQYELASDLPLVLHDCYFSDDVQFTDFAPLTLYQVYNQLSNEWEYHAIKAAMLRSNLQALGESAMDTQRIIRDLDHYAPKLEQLLIERKLVPTAPWADVAPLLPLSSHRKVVHLLSRDTGHSVDEKKQKMRERKRRREADDQQQPSVTDAADVEM